MTKTILLKSILTDSQINRAIRIYNSLAESEKSRFAERCAAEIIEPIIEKINKKTGQKNDPKYLAYCVEYAIMKSRGSLHA